MDGKASHAAHHVLIAILEQRIKLRSVALKLCAFIEDFAERVLHRHDPKTDAQFAA